MLLTEHEEYMVVIYVLLAKKHMMQNMVPVDYHLLGLICVIHIWKQGMVFSVNLVYTKLSYKNIAIRLPHISIVKMYVNIIFTFLLLIKWLIFAIKPTCLNYFTAAVNVIGLGNKDFFQRFNKCRSIIFEFISIFDNPTKTHISLLNKFIIFAYKIVFKYFYCSNKNLLTFSVYLFYW